MVNVYALAFLTLGDQLLLARRGGSDSAHLFGAQLYSLVGGRVEQGETARHAAHREVLEEVGLDIPESAFELVHTLHRKGTETEFVALCFKIDVSRLPTPKNNEPDKHDEIRFFNLKQLPEQMIPAHRQIIECVQRGINYSEHGW